MKVSKRDAKLLLVLAGLLVFLGLYLGVFNRFQAKADAVRQSINELQPQLDELEQQYLDLAKYEQGIRDYRSSVETELAAYPVGIKEEDFLSWLLRLEAREGIRIDSVSFDAPALLSEFPAVMEKGGADAHTTMDAYRAGVVMVGQMTYPQLKSVVDALYADDVQTSLDSVALSYNMETGKLTGTFAIARYYVQWEDSVYEAEPVPETPLGVNDPFGTT